MPTPLEKAREYLETLEADRRNALELSEQKAEQAKLIKARQEGFQAAMEILGLTTSVDNAGSSNANAPAAQRIRRSIRKIILRELSFSGQTMTATQIAKAINYNLTRTKTALSRMEATGQVVRNGVDRWTIAIGAMTQLNEHAVSGGNGKPL
jgi:predicted transcriptional regulator